MKQAGASSVMRLIASERTFFRLAGSKVLRSAARSLSCLGQQFACLVRIVIVLGLQVWVITVLAQTDRAIKARGETLEQVIDDPLSVDGVANRLTHLFLVERRLGLHR